MNMTQWYLGYFSHNGRPYSGDGTLGRRGQQDQSSSEHPGGQTQRRRGQYVDLGRATKRF